MYVVDADVLDVFQTYRVYIDCFVNLCLHACAINAPPLCPLAALLVICVCCYVVSCVSLVLGLCGCVSTLDCEL